MTKLIPLTRGFSAIVDDADFDWLAQLKWCYQPGRNGKIGYAIRTITTPIQYAQFMHKLILGIGGELQVDHIDLNPLNNQRSNLRPATHSQNLANQKPRSSTGYKGVQPLRGSKKFGAYISIDGRTRYLGSFVLPVDAARAYDAAALLHFGEFAYLNFPQERSI
jgi:hypothetical protein